MIHTSTASALGLITSLYLLFASTYSRMERTSAANPRGELHPATDSGPAAR